MKKVLFLTAIIILIFTANAFGQNHRKKRNFRPEIDDQVLVAFRKKQTKRKSHDKYANQEVSYRKKSKLRKGVTHDPEFEIWANRKTKSTKIRRNK